MPKVQSEVGFLRFINSSLHVVTFFIFRYCASPEQSMHQISAFIPIRELWCISELLRYVTLWTLTLWKRKSIYPSLVHALSIHQSLTLSRQLRDKQDVGGPLQQHFTFIISQTNTPCPRKNAPHPKYKGIVIKIPENISEMFTLCAKISGNLTYRLHFVTYFQLHVKNKFPRQLRLYTFGYLQWSSVIIHR